MTSRGAISDVLVKIGQRGMPSDCLTFQPVSCDNCFNSLHLQRPQVTDSQKPISTVMRVCHPYSNVDTTGCLGIVSSIVLVVFLLASLNKIKKFEKIKERHNTICMLIN